MDERKVGLVRNTTILTIGNFSSKILSFLLVPMYSHYFLPSDYGEVDLYLTLLSMLYIVVSLQSIESSFRLVQDSKNREDHVVTITNALTTAIVGIFIFSIIMTIYGWITSFQYSFLFIVYVTFSILANLFLHTIRGMNKTLSYAIIGVISTLITVVCNVLFVVGIGMGAISLIVTPIIVNAATIVLVLYKEKMYKYCKLSAINFHVIKEQLKFSLPLIPNAISIWLLSSIGRFVLLLFYGTYAVGLLTFTLKFPMLLGTISGIFYMAWQVSAISQFNAKDKDKFASEVFNQFTLLLLSSFFVFLPALKVLIFTTMGESYLETWAYIPVFFVGIVFKAFAQFYEIGFFGAKKTGLIFYSSLLAAIVYFIVALVLVKPFYILGIGIAYSLSELIHWLYIRKKVSQYLNISISVSKQLPVLLLVILFIGIYYLADIWVQSCMFFIGVLLVMKFNWGLFQKLLIILKGHLKK